MDKGSMDKNPSYSQVYSPLDPYILAGLRSGANLGQSISQTWHENGSKPSFYNISFDNISFRVSGFDEQLKLKPMPSVVDDLLGFATIERENYNVMVYRIKSPESISEKLWRNTSVLNDCPLYGRSTSQYFLDYSTYKHLFNSKEISREQKKLIKDTIYAHRSLDRQENLSYNLIDELHDVSLEEIAPLLSSYVSELNSIHDLFYQKRNKSKMDLDFWAGENEEFKSFEGADFFELFNNLGFTIHCENNSITDEYIRLCSDYLKLFYKTQHNLLFQSPIFYIYSAIRELEYAGATPSSDLKKLSELSVSYDLFCSNLLFNINMLTRSQDVKIGLYVHDFHKKRKECIALCQKILRSLNNSPNASDYALARRMFAIYIMRLSWTDPHEESKLYSRFSKLACNYEGYSHASNYIKSRAKINMKIHSFHKILFPPNGSGGKKEFKRKRSMHLQNLREISRKLYDAGAFVYGARASDYLKSLVSHSSYKLGPQKYHDIRDVFSPWQSIKSALSHIHSPNPTRRALEVMSESLETYMSDFLYSIRFLASEYVSDGKAWVDDQFFAKNNFPAHCVDKFTPDAFPPVSQMKHHTNISTTLCIDGTPAQKSSPATFCISYKDQYNLRFSFSLLDLRHNPQSEAPPRPDKRAVAYGPLIYPEYLERAENTFMDLSALQSMFAYTRKRALDKVTIPQRLHKKTYALASYLANADFYRGCKFSEFSKFNGEKIILNELYLKPEVLSSTQFWDTNFYTDLELEWDSHHRCTCSLPTSKFPSSIGEIRASIEADILDNVLKDSVLSYRLEQYWIDSRVVANKLFSQIAKSKMRESNQTQANIKSNTKNLKL